VHQYHGSGNGSAIPLQPKPKQKTKPPTDAQVNNAKSVAANAAAFFGGLALAANLVSKILTWLSEQLLQWGAEAFLTGPWGIALGTVLLALGAAAGVLAWQANKLSVMLGVLSVMYIGENRMPNSLWTVANVQAFGIAAGATTTAAGLFIDFASIFTKLPGSISTRVLAHVDNTLASGRIVGGALGFFNGEMIARQINYYTDLEANCLTQTTCATS
jgi:hypothetical protein